jgi:hypothetical protein
MKRTILFIAAVFSALSASAKALKVDGFKLDNLHLVGAYCKFDAGHDTLLASDWDTKFWMKIDGRIIEFQSLKTDGVVESQLKSKRWREALNAEGIKISLDLVETGRGDDTAAFRGSIDVLRDGYRKQFLVSGGCGA